MRTGQLCRRYPAFDISLWYSSEMLLAAAAEWHLPFLYPLYGLARDCLLPALFFKAVGGSEFVWRGNEMQVERMRPRRMMARVRPRLQEVAAAAADIFARHASGSEQ